MISGNEIICGRRFQLISDFIWDTNCGIDYERLVNGSIIWCKTDYVRQLFQTLKTHTNKYILVTHNSDISITKQLFDVRPPCIAKWFGQNVDYKHDNLIPLPIGLENDAGPSKGRYTDYSAYVSYVNNVTPMALRCNDKVYCNFTAGTNPNRLNVISTLKSNGVASIGSRSDFSKYCFEMKGYCFVGSPPGNGIDCHRTWEALGLGCIPIVQRHFMYDTYSELPIIQIDDWNMVTYDFLRQQYEAFKQREIDYNKLNIKYWFDAILKEKEFL